MSSELKRIDPRDTGLSGMTRNAAFAACLEAMRDGATLPHALEEYYGVWAVRQAQRAISAGTAHIMDRRHEVAAALMNEMHLAPKASTRVSAGSTLLKVMAAYDMQRLNREAGLRDPETRAEAAQVLRDLEPDIFDLLVDTWIAETPTPPRAIEFVRLLINSPQWAGILLEEGWSKQ